MTDKSNSTQPISFPKYLKPGTGASLPKSVGCSVLVAELVLRRRPPRCPGPEDHHKSHHWRHVGQRQASRRKLPAQDGLRSAAGSPSYYRYRPRVSALQCSAPPPRTVSKKQKFEFVESPESGQRVLSVLHAFCRTAPASMRLTHSPNCFWHSFLNLLSPRPIFHGQLVY
jgi:hypothetical protein